MTTERRAFLKRALAGLLALSGIGVLAAGTAVLLPRPGKEQGLAFVPLLPEDEVPRQGVRKAELVYARDGAERRTRVFLVASSGGLSVLSAVCSHLGCLVTYRREKGEFVCPCHGGRYDLSGRNIAGPPPAPLTSYPVKVENGMVMVGVRT